MKKNMILWLAGFLVAALVGLTLFGCSKDDGGKGTLNIKAWSPEGEVYVAVYPYVEGWATLSPVASAVLSSDNKTVSFELNAGDYMVSGKKAGSIGVQIQAGGTVDLELKDSGFVRQ